MDIPTAVLTLIHVLVLVYWLGGDLGAFYGSTYMIDPKRSVAERRMALQILNNVDMAPRTALILTLPSGLALAWAKSWITVPVYLPLVVGVASFGWLALAWGVHFNHSGSGAVIRRLDIGVRWLVLIALFGSGIAGLAKVIDLPLFVALKLIILAMCVSLGLVVRKQIAPLFVAFHVMVANGATPATDAAIKRANGNARISVLTLWALLVVAAWLGIATPV